MNLKLRQCDDFGCGHFGASRGLRKHIGVDILASDGDLVKAIAKGTVTKLGYPYGDDLSYRYVEVTASDGLKCRYFYVWPSVRLGDSIAIGTVLGTCQDLTRRYAKISNHWHFEILDNSGKAYDPTALLLLLEDLQ